MKSLKTRSSARMLLPTRKNNNKARSQRSVWWGGRTLSWISLKATIQNLRQLRWLWRGQTFTMLYAILFLGISKSNVWSDRKGRISGVMSMICFWRTISDTFWLQERVPFQANSSSFNRRVKRLSERCIRTLRARSLSWSIKESRKMKPRRKRSTYQTN